MEQLAQYAKQLSEVIHQHAPATAFSAALPTAIAALVFGVAICVLGAMLARWLITIVFAVAGLVGGLSLGGHVDLSPLVLALLGAAALGTLGYALHRLWVGVATAAFLASVAFGVLSTQMILPHLDEFKQQQAVEARVEVTEFHPGPVGDAVSAGWEQFSSYMDAFGHFVVAREPNLQKYGLITVPAAAGLGLLMGVFLCRITLILFSAAFGTSLIAAGIAMLGQHVEVDMLKLCESRPEMTAAALASFFVFSIILQSLLTRGGGSQAAASAKSS